jgi:hypothetical protein
MRTWCPDQAYELRGVLVMAPGLGGDARNARPSGSGAIGGKKVLPEAVRGRIHCGELKSPRSTALLHSVFALGLAQPRRPAEEAPSQNPASVSTRCMGMSWGSTGKSGTSCDSKQTPMRCADAAARNRS